MGTRGEGIPRGDGTETLRDADEDCREREYVSDVDSGVGEMIRRAQRGDGVVFPASADKGSTTNGLYSRRKLTMVGPACILEWLGAIN